MTEAMKPKIRNSDTKVYLNNICVEMKKILNLWYQLMRTMKSVEFQNDEDCLKFEEIITAMSKAINSLIKNPPVPGCALKHSKQLKSHLLFDWEIRDFLQAWRTLGAVDEQNIEGVHPHFNQLVRRFENTRERCTQQLAMNEFLFSYSTWNVKTVDDVLRKTRRRRMRGVVAEIENNTLAPSGSVEDALAEDTVEPPGVGGEAGGADGDGRGRVGGNPAVTI